MKERIKAVQCIEENNTIAIFFSYDGWQFFVMFDKYDRKHTEISVVYHREPTCPFCKSEKYMICDYFSGTIRQELEEVILAHPHVRLKMLFT